MSRLLSWVGVESMPLITKGPTVYQTSYGLLQEVLREVLWAVVESRSDTRGGRGSVRWRACAALYSLVVGHPVDRWGRCRSCRRPGAVFGRVRRRCQVRVTVCFWLHQPDETLLLDLLAHELDLHPARSAGAGGRVERSGSGREVPAADPDTTDVVPRIDLDQDDPLPQVPAVPRPPLSGAGMPPARRSAPGSGGAGKHRLSRSPAEDSPADARGDPGVDPEHGRRDVRLWPDSCGESVPAAGWPLLRWGPVGVGHAGALR